MSILNRKLRRDFFRTKGLLLAVVAIIAVGTGSFVGMLATFNQPGNVQVSLLRPVQDGRFLDRPQESSRGGRPAPVPHRRGFRNPGPHRLRGDRGPRRVDKPISGQAISMPAEPLDVINDIVLRQGSYFTGDRPNEVIISEKFAEARNIAPGSFIHLILNGQRKKLFVVGTAISSEHIYLAPPGGFVCNAADYGLFYIKRAYAEDVFGFHGACNNVSGLFTPAGGPIPAPFSTNWPPALRNMGFLSPRPCRSSSPTSRSPLK